MIVRALIVLLVAYGTSVSAGIYRWVDADGRVHFSDRPHTNPVTEQVTVPGEAAKAKAEDETMPPAPTSADARYLGVYQAFEIAAPDPGATLIQESTDVPVSILLDPPLMPGHRMEVLVDGSKMPLSSAVTQFKLTKLGLGSHRLQIQILDDENRLVARTSAQSFHLRKPQKLGVLR